MKKKIWQRLSLLLALTMLFTCIPLSAAADDTSPTVDGVKDAAYTADKMTKISNAFAGPNGAPTVNTNKVAMDIYYCWDDTNVYVWVDFFDSDNVNLLDVLYYRAGVAKNTDESAIYSKGGGEFSYNVQTKAVGNSQPDVLTAVAAPQGEGVRSYEFSFPHNGKVGFTIGAVSYINASYVVSYRSGYQFSNQNKRVRFEDESTYLDETAVEKEIEKVEVDGVKEENYTDAKMTKINSAFAGDRGAAISNTNNVSINAYYYWDNTNVYMWVDFYDPKGVNQMDVVYFKPTANSDRDEEAIYMGGGTFVHNADGSDACDFNALSYAHGPQQTGVRSYEFAFPHNGETGFTFSAVAYISSTYTVSYRSSYQWTANSKKVVFEDETTHLDTSAFIKDDPGPGPGPVDPFGRVDGVKEEAYTDAQMLEISTAYAGPGAIRTENVNHIYIRSYYYWDDTNVYIWVDFYDPDNVITIDAFYYVAGTFVNDGGPIYLKTDGGQFAYYPATDIFAIQKPEQLSAVAGSGTGATRSYEFSFAHLGLEGFMFTPVAYVNNNYTVSYKSSYLATAHNKTVLFNDPSSFIDTTAIDKNVVTDPSQLTAIKAAIERLPEDPSTLQSTDKSLVDEVKSVVTTVPAAWLNRLDANLVARYEGALKRMLDIEAQQREAEIKAVEDEIKALPEAVDLTNTDAVQKAKDAFDKLGEIASYVDKTLQNKLNAALNRLQTLVAPVKIDGQVDAAYSVGTEYEISQEYGYNSSSTVLGTDPDVTGIIRTIVDENYSYIYVEVFDNDIVAFPNDKNWAVSDEIMYDGILTYVNLDPSNDPVGDPAGDNLAEDNLDFYFHMRADGTIAANYIQKEKNEFLANPNSFVPFKTENSYGYEMRLPRPEDETELLMNFVIVDPKYTTDSEGKDVLSYDDSRFIALGGEWSANYLQFGQWYYDEDFPVLKNYTEVIAMINDLPAANTITDATCKPKAKAAREAYDLLNVDQKALVSEEVVKHLTDVEAKLATIPDTPVTPVMYGDLNNDKKVNATDALIALKIAVGKQKADEQLIKLADVDGNKQVNANDALLILKKAVDKIKKFPVEE